MTQIELVQTMNDVMINYLKKMNLETTRNEIISKILEDKACFFKISKEDAYIILKDIGINESELEKKYNKLISNKEYYELKQRGIIDENDDELVIKYKEYNSEDLFNNN